MERTDLDKLFKSPGKRIELSTYLRPRRRCSFQPHKSCEWIGKKPSSDKNQLTRLKPNPVLFGIFPKSAPLLRAAYEGDVDVIRQLLLQGIPVDITNQAGLRALHFAAKTGNVDLASELLRHGASVNTTSNKGNSPLHVAALLGQTDIIKLLLKHGAEVNHQSACNEDQFTPLYMAAQIGHLEIVMLLLAQGADPTVPTKNGSTPKDVAYQQGHKAVAELLDEYERRINSDATLSSDQQDGSHSPEGDVEVSNGDGDLKCKSCPKVPSHQEVIPSPRHSPLKTKSTAAWSDS